MNKYVSAARGKTNVGKYMTWSSFSRDLFWSLFIATSICLIQLVSPGLTSRQCCSNNICNIDVIYQSHLANKSAHVRFQGWFCLVLGRAFVQMLVESWYVGQTLLILFQSWRSNGGPNNYNSEWTELDFNDAQTTVQFQHRHQLNNYGNSVILSYMIVRHDWRTYLCAVATLIPNPQNPTLKLDPRTLNLN